MNFARLVHILCSIWPYENGLIKQFKHKDQCPIYNASPSCFGKFLFLWKTCLNLYSKWAMIFRSPHLFFSFLLFYFIFFFLKKKSDQALSQHIKIFYLSHYKAHLECSLSPLFYSQMGLASSLKSLVNWLKKISSLNPHWALGEPTHPCLWFVGFQNLPKAWIGS